MSADTTTPTTPVDPANPPADNRDQGKPPRDQGQPPQDPRPPRDFTPRGDDRNSAGTRRHPIDLGETIGHVADDPDLIVGIDGPTGKPTAWYSARAVREKLAELTGNGGDDRQPPAPPPVIERHFVLPVREPKVEKPAKFRGFVELRSPTGRQFVRFDTDELEEAHSWAVGMTDPRIDAAEAMARERQTAELAPHITPADIKLAEEKAKAEGARPWIRGLLTALGIALAAAAILFLILWLAGVGCNDDAPVPPPPPAPVCMVCGPTCPTACPAPAPLVTDERFIDGRRCLTVEGKILCDGATGPVGPEGPKGDTGDRGSRGPEGKPAPAPAPEPASSMTACVVTPGRSCPAGE